jgi:hypothetical protein
VKQVEKLLYRSRHRNLCHMSISKNDAQLIALDNVDAVSVGKIERTYRTIEHATYDLLRRGVLLTTGTAGVNS